MGLLSRWRGPRAVDGVQWREIRLEHREAVTELAALGLAADGTRRADASTGLFLGMPDGHGIGGYAGEQLVAAVLLRTWPGPTIEGHVHPAYRGRGLGGAALDWALSRAPAKVVVRTAALTPAAQRLFESRGLHLAAALERLWLPLGEPVETVAPPAGITIGEWDDVDGYDVYAESFAQLPANRFADAEEPDRAFEDWVKWTGYSEIDAGHSLLARDGDGDPVGFVSCWEHGPIQIGVLPEWRRRGLGRALLTAAMARVTARPDHDEPVELTVNAGNAAAAGLFRRCGFQADTREGYFTAR
jgi:mycothiol synthase